MIRGDFPQPAHGFFVRDGPEFFLKEHQQVVFSFDAPEYIEALLDELISCTIWHFRHEERLMILYKYKGFEEHKAEHIELIDSVSELQQKFQQENRLLTEEHIDYLSHWLTEHILGQDMKLGFYLLDVM